MHIVIAGGSGFLGTALASAFTRDGHEVTVLSRMNRPAPSRPGVRFAAWTPDGTAGPWIGALDGAAAVINLAGESIAGKRWTASQKEVLRRSRLDATNSLVAAIGQVRKPPAVFVSGSAVGYYGDRGNETLTETSQPGGDFLAHVAIEWETAAQPAAGITRLAIVRTGIVLDKRGGALPRMLPPFQMFVGGPLGSGTQYMPWIHRDDWVALVSWIVTHEEARGPFNATSPRPATNAEFSKALGRALRRPSVMPAPAFALRLMLGEMADALLLSGQRALPRRATDLGFSFRYEDIDEALASVLS